MKKFTRILTLLLAVITLFGLMPVTASAAYPLRVNASPMW